MTDIKGPNIGSQPPSSLQSMQVTAYHVEHGPQIMYRVDAMTAVAKYPHEWSLEPWPDSEKSEAPSLVAINEDWRELPFPKRRALAIKLGAPPTVTVNEADKLILTEYERRVAEAKKPHEAKHEPPDNTDHRRPRER